MLSFVTLATCLIPLIPAAPAINQKRVAAPTVTLNTATVVGSSSGGIDSFKGIPYAQPPVGQLRLKPPQSVTSNLGTIQATGTPKACPQFYSSVNTANIPSAVLGDLLDTPLVQAITDSGEDCLTVNVQRPSSANSASKLPVVYWMFGGGFEFGSTQSYDVSEFITSSVSQGKEFIYVSVNYRVGGFGFLPGAEILKDGSANLGLLDQRLGLEWTADNIEAFGGDPEKVTIWGESAGAISVFDQMALYNGNNTYKGKPLFRSGIMDSGSIIPADPVDCPKGQTIYNAVVSSAGCSGSADTLSCLRSLDYETYLNAANSVPAIFSFNSLALSYLPRPDGVTLTASPDVLAQKGLYANIPFIIGDQEDEGTLFALTQTNLSTTADLVSYFQSIYFFDATEAQIQGLVDVYPDDPAQGSPFGTGELYNIYPQYKRLAAILGDITFTLTRRLFLSITSTVNPNTPTYSYLATYDDAIPLLGTFHASDILPAYGLDPGVASLSIQAYYSNFIVNLDPNNGTTGLGLVNWPQWAQGEQLLNFGAASNSLLADNFREAQYEFLAANSFNFHI